MLNPPGDKHGADQRRAAQAEHTAVRLGAVTGFRMKAMLRSGPVLIHFYTHTQQVHQSCVTPRMHPSCPEKSLHRGTQRTCAGSLWERGFGRVLSDWPQALLLPKSTGGHSGTLVGAYPHQ